MIGFGFHCVFREAPLDGLLGTRPMTTVGLSPARSSLRSLPMPSLAGLDLHTSRVQEWRKGKQQGNVTVVQQSMEHAAEETIVVGLLTIYQRATR
jgi:hypothetical protein